MSAAGSNNRSRLHHGIRPWCLKLFASLVTLAGVLIFALAVNHTRPVKRQHGAGTSAPPVLEQAAVGSGDEADPLKEREIRQLGASDTDRQMKRFGGLVLLPATIMMLLVLVIRRGFL